MRATPVVEKAMEAGRGLLRHGPNRASRFFCLAFAPSRPRNRLPLLGRGPRFHLLKGYALLVATFLGMAGPQGMRADVNPADLEAWKAAGDVAVDGEMKRSGSSGAFRLAPGSTMQLTLRAETGSGRVSIWVYDDGTFPEGHVKERHVGPRWGIRQADGRVLVGAITYAPYLSGDKGYSVTEFHETNWFNIRGAAPRSPGWHEWVFHFDPREGAAVTINGRPARRFDWNNTGMEGISGLVLYGDSEGARNPQTLWVDDIRVELGPAMEVRPVPPPPPPPVVPDKDPSPEGNVPELVEAVRGNHPRLLFTAGDLPRMREFYASEAAAAWRESFESYLSTAEVPAGRDFLTNGTDAQRQGFWRLPTVALHYVLTGDRISFDRTVEFMKFFYELPHWETTRELDSGLGAANIMVGAALAYDWLYNDLDPEFREQFRQRLLLQARRLYHGGYLKKNPAHVYWQNDAQNNHRWKRLNGLTLSVLAAYRGNPGEEWIFQRTVEDLEFVNRWLPPDGSLHEGPFYLVFGGNHLVMAMDASDRCLGTDYLTQPFFRNAGKFLAGTSTSDFSGSLGFGDWSDRGLGGYRNFLLRLAVANNQPDLKDAAMRVFEQDPTSMMFAWFSLIWDSAELPRGDAANLPKEKIWPDVGVATIRDSWKEDGVSMLFKCGPFGGRLLNKFRAENDGIFINVAHDDPDANSFILAIGGELVAETDRYAGNKRSAGHNTILVNGMGQMVHGRNEGRVFSVPSNPGSVCMKEMGVITAWRVTPGIVAVEGEASGSYLPYRDRDTGRSRPGLDRFRRTLLWIEGEYLLVLDDIRAPEEVEISWLMQGPGLKKVDKTAERFRLVSETRECPFQVTASVPLDFEIALSPAEHRGESLGFQQLTASTKTSGLFVASLYELWGGQRSVRLEMKSADKAVVIVEGEGSRDIWTWAAATGRFKSSAVSGTRESGVGSGFPFVMNAENSEPPQ